MSVLWALIGMIVGPFLNLAIYRLPRLERLAAPISCPHCHVRKPFYLQSAVLASLLGARGRCRGCGAALERTAVVVELSTGIIFWLLYIRFGFGPQLLLYSLYSAYLVVIFFIDLQHRLILNRMTYPGVLAAILLTSLVTSTTPSMVLIGLAVGGGIFGGLYAFGYLLYRQEVLGLGDVKLAMVLGAMVGFPAIVMALLLASIAGAAVAAVMLVTRRHSARDFIPYGTFMCLGTLITFFFDISGMG